MADARQPHGEMDGAFRSEMFEVEYKTDNGEDAIEACETRKPRVLIMDLVLKGCDGFRVITEVKKRSPETKILVVSSLHQDAFISRAYELGADYYVVKPFTDENLCEVVLNLLFPAPKELSPRKEKQLDERLGTILLTIGIPAHIKGYQFLREAIKLSMVNPEAVNKITKYLYPTVGDKFSTTPSKVERAIRHAIEVAWDRQRIERVNEIFGFKVFTSMDKPTNGEFIALLADRLLIETA